MSGSNQVYGVDGTFAFFNNLTIATYLAQSQSKNLSGDDTSYRAQMEYGGDRYGLQLEHLGIGRNFNPEVGFVRRPDVRKSYALARFSPRPKSIKSVRKFSGVGQWTYIEDNAGQPGTRILDGEFATEFQNSDRFLAGVNDDFEHIVRPFAIAGVRIPPGDYNFTTGRIGYNFGQQRPVSALGRDVPIASAPLQARAPSGASRSGTVHR